MADDLHAGRTPRVKADGLTVADLCNRFLTAKLRKVEAGELTPRLFAEYKETTDLWSPRSARTGWLMTSRPTTSRALRATMAKQWGPVRLGNAITRVKSVFKYGYRQRADRAAVRYGPEFNKPDKSVMRRHRAKTGAKMFEADELRALIDGKDVAGRRRSPMLVKPDRRFGQ